MVKNSSYILVGLLSVVLVLFSSCGEKKSKSGRTDTYSSGTISIASDESFSPIVDEELQVFQSRYPKAHVKPVYTDETSAINMLMKGKICLVITSRNFSEKEYKNLHDRDFRPRALILGYDGLAFIVNKANNDTCISINNIKRILAGKATKWSDVVAGSRRGDIEVVFDRNNSSAVNWVVDSLTKGQGIKNPNVFAAKKSSEVISYVEKTPGAIGIIGSNWLNDQRDSTNVTFKKNIHVMSVSKMAVATPMNSWKPYQYYLYNGNYPLIRTIYALLNDPINGLPWGFANFIANDPIGQKIIYKSALLPYSASVNVRTVQVSNQ